MQQVKVTWKMAAEISRWHTLVTGSITSLIILIGLIIGYIILKLYHPAMTFNHFYLILQEYQQFLIIVILLIHLIPVNLFGIISVLKHKFPTFKLMAVLSEVKI